MNLQEKIFYCRKKAGLSQEALADRLGVSRQAVSKWETGEATPEVGKLLLLAKEFGVTTDWLLSEEEPDAASGDDVSRERSQDAYRYADEGQGAYQSANGLQSTYQSVGGAQGTYQSAGGAEGEYRHTGENQTEREKKSEIPGWIEALPGLIGKILKRFGWLAGVYVAAVGAVFTGFGALAKTMVNSVFGFASSDPNISGDFGTGSMSGAMSGMLDWQNSVIQSQMQNNPVTMVTNVIMGIGILLIIVGLVLAIVLKRYSRK